MVSPALRLLPAVAILSFLATSCGGAAGASATVTIRYSQFDSEGITVPAGVPITITLHNDDPIEHEWIVGPPEVHERHRTGTERLHASVPTEVTVPAFSTRITTITFDQAGDYAYICHLPGHKAYGMVGELRVVEG